MATLSWTLDVASPAAEAWAVLSDTDAFNRVAGLDFHFERDGEVMRGSTRVMGVRSTWVEEPFTWEKSDHFVSRRRYDSGPVKTATATCRLEERPDGTRIHYQVELEPRNAFATPVVSMLAQTSIRPALDRALKHAVAAIRGLVPFDPPEPLTDNQALTLVRGLEGLDPALSQAITRRVLNQPLRLQQCLRPLQIAQEEGLDPDATVIGFLQAVRQGALRLELHVLCPRCRGPHLKQGWLALETEGVHCPTCNIRYDGSLIENTEVVFAPSEKVRSGDVPVACVFAPARTPHILAQLQIKPGGTTRFEAKLAAGSYRLETGDAQVWLLAEPDAEAEAVAVALDDVEFHPQELRVKPGVRTITLYNQGSQSVRIALHTRWRPPHTLTVGHLFCLPEARALLPEAFIAGTDCEIRYASTLIVEGRRRDLDLARMVLRTPFTREVAQGQRGLMVDEDPEAALRHAESLASYHIPLAVGLASGPVLRFQRGDTVRWAGPALEHALSALLQARSSQTTLAPEALGEAGLEKALQARRDQVRVARRDPLPPLLAFSAWFDPPTQPSPLPAAPRAAKPPPPPVEPGAVIGRHTVLRTIGKGGMGAVFEAIDEQGNRHALKLMHRTDSAILQNLFHNESWYAQMVKHPNVIEVIDWGTCDHGPYLILELMIGQSLTERLKQQRRLDEDEVVRILKGTLEALEAVHTAGLVHRDLKPGNIFLLAEPTPVPHAIKLLDFGLARRSGLLPDEGIAGTPEHMAPEQILRQEQDARTDLYALATVAYRLLAGTHLFSAKSRGQRAIHRVDTDPSELDWRPIPPAIEPVLARALMPRPEDRWPDARSMREALP